MWKQEWKKKWIAFHDLPAKAEEIRSQGKSIATLNGSFDLMHAGHLHQIYEASKQADVLIVALNSDTSIQQYKNPQRPIVNLENRLQLMAALEFVDYVTSFDQTDPIEVLKMIKPDVHCNGIEYGKDCLEAEALKQMGSKLHLVSFIEGLSTTALIQKVQALCD